MKIVIATGLYPPDIGGPATHTVLLEKELPSRGFEIVTVPFSKVRHLPKLLRHLYYTWLLLRASRGADLLYALDPVSVGLPTFFVSVLTMKPYILRVVGDYAWEQAVQRYGVKEFIDEFVERPHKKFAVRILVHIERLVARHAEHVVVPSEYMRGIIGKWGVRDTRMTVVYNAFMPPSAEGNNKEIQNKFASYEQVVISAGRLVPWKGFRILIEVVHDMREEFPNMLLAIVGDGSQQSELEARVRELNIGSSVVFLGKLPREQLLFAIQRSDVFVLNTAYEGFSHQLLEVMTLGVPIVTTNVGGNPELIGNEKEGLLVPYNDRTALREAVEYMLKNRQEAETMSKAAKAKTESFTVERMVGDITKLFQSYSKETK